MPAEHRALGWPPRTLLWKELRELWPAVPLMLAIEVVTTLLLRRGQLTLVPSASVRLADFGAVLAAAVLGAMFFGSERQHKTAGFLLQLPVSRAALLRAKLVAAALLLALLWVLSAGLFGLLPRLSSAVAGPAWTPDGPLLLALLLAYVTCALLSLLTAEPLTALLAGLLLLAAAWWAVSGSGPAGLVLGALALAAAGWALWRRLAALEDRSFVGGEAPWRGLGRSLTGPGLLAVEQRQKGGVMALLLALPVVAALSGALPWVLFFHPPFSGAVLGVMLFTIPERDGAGFFLHHLPIRRRTLVLQRFALGLAFGAVLLLEILLLVLLRGPIAAGSDLTAAPGFLADALSFLLLTYMLCFGFGALLSPWLTRHVIGVVLALATLWLLFLVPRFGDEPWLPLQLAVVLGVLGFAWWSTVHSRALEPGSGKDLRAVLLLLPLWALIALSAVW